MAWTREDAAHLLRRVTWAAAPTAEVDHVFALGRNAAISSLLDYDSQADPQWDNQNPLGLADPQTDWSSFKSNMLVRIATSKRPLQARLTWFWHGHFTSAVSDVGLALMGQQLETWRAHAAGPFLDFLLAMYRDGAMLTYLGGNSNVKGHPNENFARENFELFTTAPGPYDENDVREAARAFTGFVVNSAGQGLFVAGRHDDGTKTILGATGSFGADDVMTLANARPETARHICTRLYRQFVGERVSIIELSRLTAIWRTTGGNLREVMRALLTSSAFWDVRNRGMQVRGPLEFVLALVKALGLSWNVALAANAVGALSQMGAAFLDPPNVAGYPAGTLTTGAANLLGRYRFARFAVYGVDTAGIVARVRAGLVDPASADDLLARLPVVLGMATPGAATRSAIGDWIGNSPLSGSALNQAILGGLHLLACSPEFQLT
jgi:uncharacterized protein (DUF1800 family)